MCKIIKKLRIGEEVLHSHINVDRVRRGENVGQRLAQDTVDDVIIGVLSKSSDLFAYIGVDGFEINDDWHGVALGGYS